MDRVTGGQAGVCVSLGVMCVVLRGNLKAQSTRRRRQGVVLVVAVASMHAATAGDMACA